MQNWRPVKYLVVLAAALALALVVPAAVAQDPAPVPADSEVELTTADCRVNVEVLIVAISDWMRFARALAADPSPCAEYWVSVPPGAIRTNLRAATVFAAIRNLSPHIHPVAEMTLGEDTGWAFWVESQGKTWFEAGVEFRRRMELAGLDPQRGETWLINEFDRSTRRDVNFRDDAEKANDIDRAYPRAAMRELVRGLYFGDGTMPVAPGAAEIGIHSTHQNLPDVPAYKEEMKAWLEDGAFWADMDGRVRWLLKEVYADTRRHSVPGSLLSERRHHLRDYQQHVFNLARAGRREAPEAYAFLEKTHTPLLNGGWEALGGDAFEFTTGHGNTEISPVQMLHFVSEQVLAASKVNHADRKSGRPARIAFDWQTIDRAPLLPPGEFEAARDAITARIASAIRDSYPEGEPSENAACGLPGSGENWCQAEREGAFFTKDWKIFKRWK